MTLDRQYIELQEREIEPSAVIVDVWMAKDEVNKKNTEGVTCLILLNHTAD